MHSGMQEATVRQCSVISPDMLLTVAVQDSGEENERRSGSASSGLGLIGLRERVESLGGTFKVLRELGTRHAN